MQSFSQATGGAFGGVVNTHTEFQQSRPSVEQVLSEALSPVGLAEAPIPIG